MKKLAVASLICLVIITSGCGKEVKNNSALADQAQNKTETKVETKEKFYFIKEAKERFPIKTFDHIANSYFTKYVKTAKEDLKSKSREEVLKIFNNKSPAYEIGAKELLNGSLVESSELSNKTAWIYTLDGQDSTAVYILLEKDKVIDYKISEFNGISNTYDNVVGLFEGF
ncbi:hypothetical protein [Clostridium polynesiense]|uniref:hypothetical protein n=1 Tax=Clostridium polynesiense TaxID=1325933 RepID=UPI00058EAA37|nr:hypothetical protein [Clostridium polynesiense]